MGQTRSDQEIIMLQFLDDKDWIAENFPTDLRTELALVTADNALLPENIQYVSRIWQDGGSYFLK